MSFSTDGSIDDSSGIALGLGGQFDVSLKSGYSVETLSGNGTLAGAITVTSNLAIGNSPGTIDFDSLTLGSSATYTYEVTGGNTTADLGNVAGLLDISDSALDMVQLGVYTPGDKFTLFGYASGNLTGTFAGLSQNATFTDADGSWTINDFDTSAGLNGGTGTSFVTVMAVPEPTSLAILGSSLALIGVGIARRRQAKG